MLFKMSADSVSMLSECVVGSEVYTDWVTAESEEMVTAVNRKVGTLLARDTSSAMRCVKASGTGVTWLYRMYHATYTETIIVNIVNCATLRH